MSIHIVPVNKLSASALRGVIEEFISRQGIDSGETEASLTAGVRQVKQKLLNGSAVLIFDDETATTGILSADDPILRKLNCD
ncbi:MAG: YheU family protein [Smithella sp.]